MTAPREREAVHRQEAADGGNAPTAQGSSAARSPACFLQANFESTRRAQGRSPRKSLAWAALCALALWAAFCGAELLARTEASVSVRWVSPQAGAQPVTAQQIVTALERLRKNWEKTAAQAQETAGGLNAVNVASTASASETLSAPSTANASETRGTSTTPSAQESNASAEVPPALAFWRETQAEVISANRTADAAVLSVLGDASLCYPAQMLSGALPAADDSFGCAVSEQLAWLLWGSTDVVGLPLRLHDSHAQAYSVRGVFRSAQAFVICAESEGHAAQESKATAFAGGAGTPPSAAKKDEAAQGFTALEIRGLSSGDRRTALQALLQAANLPAPLQISWVGTRASLARALCLAPFVVAAFYLFASAWRILWRRFSRFHGLLLFAAALSAALLLPFLLAQIPAWLIPARWSDATFWSGLWRTLVQETENALALIPFSPDIPARLALLQTAGGSALALWCVAKLRAVWGRP